jgi:hypothetical protein
MLYEADFEQLSRSWIDEWLLNKIIAGALRDLGRDEDEAWWAVSLVKLLTTHQRWYVAQASGKKGAIRTLESWLHDGEVQHFLQVNRYQDVLWFNKEAFEQLARWMLFVATVSISAESPQPAVEVAPRIVAAYDPVKRLLQAEEKSEYQLERLLAVLRA